MNNESNKDFEVSLNYLRRVIIFGSNKALLCKVKIFCLYVIKFLIFINFPFLLSDIEKYKYKLSEKSRRIQFFNKQIDHIVNNDGRYCLAARIYDNYVSYNTTHNSATYLFAIDQLFKKQDKVKVQKYIKDLYFHFSISLDELRLGIRKLKRRDSKEYIRLNTKFEEFSSHYSNIYLQLIYIKYISDKMKIYKQDEMGYILEIMSALEKDFNDITSVTYTFKGEILQSLSNAGIKTQFQTKGETIIISIFYCLACIIGGIFKIIWQIFMLIIRPFKYLVNKKKAQE